MAKEMGNDFKQFCKNILINDHCSADLTLHLLSQY